MKRVCGSAAEHANGRQRGRKAATKGQKTLSFMTINSQQHGGGQMAGDTTPGPHFTHFSCCFQQRFTPELLLSRVEVLPLLGQMMPRSLLPPSPSRVSLAQLTFLCLGHNWYRQQEANGSVA